MFAALVFSAIVAVALGAAVPAHPKLDGRIVGGRPVDIEDYPYQVSLQYYGSHICGGTLINSKTVVTAAHCTSGFAAKDLSISYGASETAGNRADIDKVNIHPQYDSRNIDYDITVITLKEAIAGSPARLPTDSDKLSAGDIVDITGWGALTEGGGSPKQLQLVQVPVVSNAECNASYGQGSITDRMMCAGLKKGGKDACQGDSGGPLVKDNILWGVVSWGYGCARPNYPGVYSSVANLRSFVEQYA